VKRFTDAGRKAIADNNLYAALSLALMMPDICASLEEPGPGKVKQRYTKWFTRWALPKFPLPKDGVPLISADDCYLLRCSLIHSGSARGRPTGLSNPDPFIFFDDTTGTHLGRCSNSYFMGRDGKPQWFGYVQLKASAFSETMFSAVDEWDAASLSDPAIQSERRNYS